MMVRASNNGTIRKRVNPEQISRRSSIVLRQLDYFRGEGSLTDMTITQLILLAMAVFVVIFAARFFLGNRR
jgi:hypothetical protein